MNDVKIKAIVSGTINGRPMTKAELASERIHIRKLHAQIQTQMNALRKALNVNAPGSMGHVGIGSQGGVGTFKGGVVFPETKQPQDKVLRLVMARGDEKYVITQCVIVFLGSLFLGFILGAYITSANDVVWWAVLPMVVISCAPMALIAYLIKQKFKQAEAKADLLNWPE